MPLVYCDHNFIVYSHDGPEAYKTHLRGLSVAGFVDAISSRWLYDRRTIQRREVEDTFFRFIGVPYQALPMLAAMPEVLADLNRTSAAASTLYRESRPFVEKMRTLGNDHPLEVSILENFTAHQQNGERYGAGELTPEVNCREAAS